MKTKREENKEKTVLITGASNGFGMEFAKLFAKDGYNLILVARSTERLRRLGYQLQDEHQLEQVSVITADLSEPGVASEVYQQVKDSGIHVDILVNNAGAGVHGPFEETDLEREQAIIQLNVNTPVELTKHFLKEMKQRGDGKILNVASIVSFMPSPLMAIYGATKAFILSFSEALSNELKDTGITVTALCPGASNTMFFRRAGAAHTRAAHGDLLDPAEVARDGYKALMSGEVKIVSGLMSKLQATSSNVIPDTALAASMRYQMEEDEGEWKQSKL
ncbi:SDR family NAD(P)-dependent oxidoreductase [Pontibacter cellulosilyticus]|uniref:SDR family oxidoreductase n=1 Tax=Pontibacter cellulosilyticus TaxID=1720253 RepID=A0A923N2J7_9BACT|nr:SDR family oxidoreductase [Pontibacter cellulosilyticus]MBC5991710.1 SDR family oxidoreductase [Pontibacter cellulosilyticus]